MVKIKENNTKQPNREWQIITKVIEREDQPHQIILHNDDFNTFDFVIKALIEICDHTPIQAEQCTYLVHFKGKCSVLSGTLEELKPKCSALLDRQLSAELV